MRKFLTMLSLLALAGVVMSAPPVTPAEKTVSPATAGGTSLGHLRQDIENVLNDRETALRELAAAYEVAPLDQRVALESQMAQVQSEYERRYLELMVDYHRLSGNAEELARAERMLENLNAGMATATPLSLPRDLRSTQTPAEPEPAKEGVVRNEH